MRRLVMVVYIGLVFVGLALAPAAVVMANPVGNVGGQRLTMEGLDNGGATAKYYLESWAYPIVGSVVGAGSLVYASRGHMVEGGVGVASGVGIGIWPQISSPGNQAAAATAQALPGELAWLPWALVLLTQVCALTHVLVVLRRHLQVRYVDPVHRRA